MSNLEQKERRGKEGKTTKGEKGKGKKRSVMFACLDEEEVGPRNVEIYRKLERILHADA